MTKLYPVKRWGLATSLLFSVISGALAQGPVITGVLPLANASAVAPSSQLRVSFNQSLTAASAGALNVFSSQRGGLRSRALTPGTVTGSTLSFRPQGFSYAPGEIIQYTVTSAAASSGGSLAQPRVGQFRVAAGGLGANSFGFSNPCQSGYTPQSVKAGDMDGDGDLDLIVANGGSSVVTINLNNGNGTFSAPTLVRVGNSSTDVSVGDLNGDGNLDFVTPNGQTNNVNVRLNYGSPFTFTNAPDVNVGTAPGASALGDMDGDGDLDLLVTSRLQNGSVTVCYNDGHGNFPSVSTFPVGAVPIGIALGDLDGDGDLDCAVANSGPGPGNGLPASTTVSLVYNNGNGQNFTSGPTVNVGFSPEDVVLGDLDGDGDLDLATVNVVSSYYASGFMSIALNNGAGTFAVRSLNLSSVPGGITMGDVDGDGDLDLVATIAGSFNGGGSYWGSTAQVALNDSQGGFRLGQIVGVGSSPSGAALADLNGDGVLDLAVANSLGNYVSVCLNQTTLSTATAAAATPLALGPNPAREAAVLTGARPRTRVDVLDVLGHVVFSTTTDQTGAAQLTWAGRLAAGLYVVHCGEQSCRLVVTD